MSTPITLTATQDAPVSMSMLAIPADHYLDEFDVSHVTVNGQPHELVHGVIDEDVSSGNLLKFDIRLDNSHTKVADVIVNLDHDTVTLNNICGHKSVILTITLHTTKGNMPRSVSRRVN